MEKYYLKNGKEVKIGDTILKKEYLRTPLGERTTVTPTLVTKELIEKLLQESNISKSVTGDTAETATPTLNYAYIKGIAARLNWKKEKVMNLLITIGEMNNSAAFSIALKEIAIELDKKYKDHIQNSPKIFVVSLFDGRITEANKAHIKNYRNFAAFRSIEDAKIACKLLSPCLKEMFKSGRK